MKTILVILMFCLSSCTSTYVTSMKDPQYEGKTFQRVLVIAAFKKIDALKGFENSIVKELKKQGVFAVSNHTLMPPLREFTNDEKIEIYKKYDLDSYLIISPDGIDYETIYVPTVSSSKTTPISTGNVTSYLNKTVTQEGGAREIATTFNSIVKFYDISNGNAFWQGDISTNIKLTAYMEDVARSLVPKVINKLIIDNCIKSTIPIEKIKDDIMIEPIDD